MKTENIIINEERLSPEEYIDFLKRTDLGSQYPKERFTERITKLVKNVSISLVIRNYERRGIATKLMKKAHELAGGEKDIAVYLIANDNAIPFYKKLGINFSNDVMQYNHIDWTEWTVE